MPYSIFDQDYIPVVIDGDGYVIDFRVFRKYGERTEESGWLDYVIYPMNIKLTMDSKVWGGYSKMIGVMIGTAANVIRLNRSKSDV